MRIFAININFLKHLPFATIFFLESFDVRIAAGLLPAELIAREGQHFEALPRQLVVELYQLSVVLVGEASLWGDVRDEDSILTLYSTS